MRSMKVHYNTLLIPLFLVLLCGIGSCHDPSAPMGSHASTADRQKEAKLTQLFKDLKYTEDPYETMEIQSKIWEIWMDCDTKEISELMKNGMNAMEVGEYERAVDFFTQVTEIKPNYAEAWNKRATSLYMMGDLEAALDDIEQTLVLEDRHFGALSGLAAIYLVEGEDRKALQTYERIERIAPAEPHVRQQIQYLRGKMGISLI